MLHSIRKSLEKRDEGFTLIELLVVIIIIGILAAIAIPVFLNQRKKGWHSAAKSDVKNMATAEETWLTESTSTQYTPTVGDLQSMGFSPTAKVTQGACIGDVGTATGQKYIVWASHDSDPGTYFYLDSEVGQLTESTVAPGANGSTTC